MVASPNEYIIELIKSFGLDVAKLIQFKLIINPDEIVRIEVLYLPTEEDIKAGNLGAQKLMKEYELVEKKKE